VYLPTDHEARYTFSNAATGTQTLGVPTFTTGFAFGMVSTLPQEVDGGVPWAIDFRFTPPAGEFGAQTDTATFPVTSGSNTYSVTVQLRATFIEGDADGDGHVSTEFEGDDCDDANPNTYAGAQEICDGFDNDCDGNLGASELDDDNDGYLGCGDDCDDDDVTRHPGAEEGCDGLDTDCDGALGADELDGDGDGWTGCDGDCEPEVAAVNPDENEDTCDGYDTDCDQGGVVPPLETDNDNDGFRACNGDCDDEEPRARPGAAEVCDGVDNDCDTILPVGGSYATASAMTRSPRRSPATPRSATASTTTATPWCRPTRAIPTVTVRPTVRTARRTTRWHSRGPRRCVTGWTTTAAASPTRVST
jgi:hypothetical protein